MWETIDFTGTTVKAKQHWEQLGTFQLRWLLLSTMFLPVNGVVRRMQGHISKQQQFTQQ